MKPSDASPRCKKTRRRVLTLVVLVAAGVALCMLCGGASLNPQNSDNSTGGIDDATFTVEGTVTDDRSDSSRIDITIAVTNCDIPFTKPQKASFHLTRSRNSLLYKQVGASIKVGDSVHIESHYLNAREERLSNGDHYARLIATEDEWEMFQSQGVQ